MKGFVALPIFFLMLLIPMPSAAIVHDTCKIVKIEAERLPDLNIPRSGHTILNVGGEVTVFGGHTTNFSPTSTAEYFKDGAWHVLPMAFTHDDGFALILSSGNVLVGGGHEKEMGIGQSWGVELYESVTHTFEGIASLDKKRVMASAVEIDSGKVVIAGNWYDGDAIELFDGQHTFSYIKEVSAGRCAPYMLRTAKDDAIILGCRNTKGRLFNESIVDRLHGESLHVPLLEKWRAKPVIIPRDDAISFIGNEQTGDYSYLLPLINDEDSVALALVRNGEFSLLPTTCSVPTTSAWGKISYYPHILVDRLSQRAYLIGYNGDYTPIESKATRLYVLTINYGQSPTPLTLGYTEPLTDCDVCYATLTSEGNLLLAGGIFNWNNFKPSAATWLLHVSGHAVKESSSSPFCWLWAAGAVFLLIVIVFWFWKRRQKKLPKLIIPEAVEAVDTADAVNKEMMDRISQQMETERLYLNPNLRVTDLADRFGIHRNQVSECINSQRGCTFSQLVASYRIAHAKQLLREKTDMKMATIASESGFASEKSFYRTFRLLTGKSPKEWAETGD